MLLQFITEQSLWLHQGFLGKEMARTSEQGHIETGTETGLIS